MQMVNPNTLTVCMSEVKDFYLESREEEMVKNVKQEKNNFTWSAMIDGIMQLYKKL